MLLGRTVDHSKCKLIKLWTAQLLTEAKGLVEHVHCTTTAGVMCPVHSQLAGTKGIWQGRATAVTVALQVSGDMTTFLESWFWTERRSDHQSNGDTRPVPNYPRWVPRKMAPSLDKWILFPGINTNSLTPIGANRQLIPKTYFSAIFLAFTILFSPLFTATRYIYSHSFSTFITPLLTLSSESIW